MGLTIIVLLWVAVYFRNKDTEGSKNAVAGATFFTLIIAVLMDIIGFFGTYQMPIAVLLCLLLLSMVPIMNRNY
jgi:Na+-translocating ferredoxin:NAD+ oxidoreductase RnfD subunit